MPDEIRFPKKRDRLMVLGRTGTGKTVAGAWHLSGWNFDDFPWLIWDTKGDSFLKELSRIPAIKQITFADNPGKKGLYIIRPLPHELDSDECENFLWRMHKRKRIGMWFDEGYMMNKFSKALNALYTQGRDLQIPLITLSQKPKYLSQFALSESDFFQVFQLNDKKDRQRVNEFMPADLERRLPDFHSLWYDVSRDKVSEFSPVPAREQILDSFDAKLRQLKRVI